MSFIKSKASSNAPASPFQSGGELRSLTGVRGVAALVVALAHFNLPAFAAFNGLFIGSFSQAVDLFFCLSGFTLALVYEPQTRTFANWRNYAAARIARIYPLYLATLLWSALIGISLGPQYPLERAWSDFLAQLALINSWPIVGTGVHWDLPAWSISVEFFCYLFLFPLLWRVRPTPNDWGAALSVLALSLAAYIGSVFYFDWRIFEPRTYQSTNTAAYIVSLVRGIAGFSSGWLIYTIYSRQSVFCMLCSKCVDAITIAIVLIIAIPVVTEIDVNSACLLFLFPFFIIGLANEKYITASMLSTPTMRAFGMYSFSIYLIHVPLKMTIDRLISTHEVRFPPILYVSMLVALLIALSAFAFYFFETPWRNLLRRLLSPSAPKRGILVVLREGWFAWPISIGLLFAALVIAAKLFWAVGPDRELVTAYSYFQIFKEGWGGFEERQIWAVGRRSVIDIRLTESMQRAKLVMRGRAFVTPAHPTATTSVFVNGSLAIALQATLDTPSFVQELDLPSGVRTLRIVLETNNPASPKSLGISDDGRELSIALESLQVKAIQGIGKAEPAPK